MKTFVLREKEVAYYKKYAESKGFTHAKLELEASFGREDGGESECYECDGDGYYYCSECDGNGELPADCATCGGDGVQTDADTLIVHECDECHGDTIECQECDSGRIRCYDCDGEGVVRNDYWDLEAVEDYILDSVSQEARNALTFIKVYNDGSVDTEATLTLPIEHIEYMIEFIEAFRGLEDEIGNGMQTSNAGMHMSLLTSGTFPCDVPLDTVKLSNFERQVTKLLPALYFLATADSYTRRLHFRTPMIAEDKCRYYPAICTKDNALEFRLFDTCYDKPEHVLDNFIVMARSLHFYDDELQPIRTKVKGDIGISEVSRISDMFYTSKHIDVLMDGLRYLRPTYKTLAQLFAERNFTAKKSDFIKRDKRLADEARKEYKKYVQTANFKNKAYFYRGYYNYYNRVAEYGEATVLADYGTINEFAKQYAEDNVSKVRPLREYVADYVRRNIGRNVERYITY